MEGEPIVTKRQLLKLIIGGSALAVGLADGGSNAITKRRLYAQTRQEVARRQGNFQRDNNGQPVLPTTPKNHNSKLNTEQFNESVNERYQKNLYSNGVPDSLTRTLGNHALEVGGAGLTLPTINEIAKSAIEEADKIS